MRGLRLALPAMSLLAVAACTQQVDPVHNFIAVSGDGNLIVFRRGDGKTRLTIYNRQLDTERNLGPSGYYENLAFASDDQSIFCSFSSDGDRWRIANLDISHDQINILTDGHDFDPVAISENRVLFWRSLDRSGDLFFGSNPVAFALYELEIDELTIRRLTNEIFNKPTDIVTFGGTAYFGNGEKLYKLDLKSELLTREKSSHPDFYPLCSTGDGAIIGSIRLKDSYNEMPGELAKQSVRILANVSNIDDAAFASEIDTLFFGCVRPWAIYSYDRSTASLTKEPIELK